MMGRHGARNGWFSRLAVSVAMLAVVVRVLIPAGFMVSPGSEPGASRIVVCSGQGAVAVLVDASGHRITAPADHGQTKGGDHSCAFASVATAPLTSAVTLMSAPVDYAAPARPPGHSGRRPGPGLAAPPPPKTGPPTQI